MSSIILIIVAVIALVPLAWAILFVIGRNKWSAGYYEAMIVIAIYGVVIAVAIPAYQDYGRRSAVAEGIALAHAARDAVARTFAAKGPADMSRSGYLGWAPPAATEDVRSVSVGKNGWISILYTEKIGEDGKNVVQIVPVANGKALNLSDPANKGVKFEWECGGAAGRTTVPPQYRPPHCR